jgi:hypothetical protein
VTRALTIESTFKIVRKAKGAKRVVTAAALPKSAPLGRIPRIAKLMALAIRWEGMIRGGALKDYAEIAALTHVSRARVTQIMNLNLLAPEIQEAILFLPRADVGRDTLALRNLQTITLEPSWDRQRRMWTRRDAFGLPTEPARSKTASPR